MHIHKIVCTIVHCQNICYGEKYSLESIDPLTLFIFLAIKKITIPIYIMDL